MQMMGGQDSVFPAAKVGGETAAVISRCDGPTLAKVNLLKVSQIYMLAPNVFQLFFT